MPQPTQPRFPRFISFHKPVGTQSRKRLCVVELLPGKYIHSTDKRRVRRVLYKSRPIEVSPSGNAGWDGGLLGLMDRAQRVVGVMNRMRLALDAWELEEDGIQKLFDKLWREDEADYQPTELDHGTTTESQTDQGAGKRTR